MAEVVIELKAKPWERRESWVRSVTMSDSDAKKVAEWLEKTLPDLVAQLKGGYFSSLEVSVKD